MGRGASDCPGNVQVGDLVGSPKGRDAPPSVSCIAKKREKVECRSFRPSRLLSGRTIRDGGLDGLPKALRRKEPAFAQTAWPQTSQTVESLIPQVVSAFAGLDLQCGSPKRVQTAKRPRMLKTGEKQGGLRKQARGGEGDGGRREMQTRGREREAGSKQNTRASRHGDGRARLRRVLATSEKGTMARKPRFAPRSGPGPRAATG